VTTRRPDLNEAGGYVAGTINDIGGWNVNGAINVPVIDGILGVRVAGIIDESDDDNVRSLNSSTKPSRKTEGLRASVQFNPFDILDLYFSYTENDRKVTTFDQVVSANLGDPTLPASLVLISGKERLSVMSKARSFRQRFKVFNWQGELRVAGQKLNYVGAIHKQKLDSTRGQREPYAARDDLPGYSELPLQRQCPGLWLIRHLLASRLGDQPDHLPGQHDAIAGAGCALVSRFGKVEERRTRAQDRLARPAAALQRDCLPPDLQELRVLVAQPDLRRRQLGWR